MRPTFLVLATVGCLSLPTLGKAQDLLKASGPLPTFDVTTIKKAGADTPNATNVRHYIQIAYGIPTASTARVISGPAWLPTNQYVINGKASDTARNAMQKMTKVESSKETRLMQQALLAERFHLKAHIETREMPVYELLPAKGGAKIKEVHDSAKDDNSLPPIPSPNAPLAPASIARGTTMARIVGPSVEYLGHAVPAQSLVDGLLMQFELEGRPVVDKSGLKGKYDFLLKWAAMLPPSANGASPASSENNGPSLFTALQEELGLRLVAARDPVEVLVIDHIELPTEN